jgi:hypothetical protein
VSLATAIGPSSRLLDNQPPEILAVARERLRQAYAPYVNGDSVVMGASIWIVTAHNS